VRVAFQRSHTPRVPAIEHVVAVGEGRRVACTYLYNADVPSETCREPASFPPYGAFRFLDGVIINSYVGLHSESYSIVARRELSVC
jgi:hypothetical protein